MRVVLLGALALGYIVSHFLRAALAVVAPEAARDAGLSPEQLGTLSAVYFWTFAALQLPVGVLLDRFRADRVTAAFLVLLVAGTALFAVAPDYPTLLAAQALIGAGCAPILMASFVVIARAWPPARFAAIGGFVMAIGNLGNLLGATPLAWASAQLGWRLAIASSGVAAALVLAALLAIGPRLPSSLAPRPTGETLLAAARGGVAVFGRPALWPLLPLAFMGYAAILAVRGLWAGPWLEATHGLDAGGRGEVLLAMAAAMAAMPLVAGWAEARLGRQKPIVLAGSGGAAACLLTLAVAPDMRLEGAAALLMAAGFLGMTYTIVMTHARMFLAPHEIGRGVTALNCLNFLGVGVAQAVSGLVAGGFPPDAPPHAVYGAVFLLLGGGLALSVVAYAFARDGGRAAA